MHLKRKAVIHTDLYRIENVRILGPVRSKSQVEVSATDALRLGVKAPIRESGNIVDSAAIAVVGPKGAIYLNEGCIIAKRHIHMAPKDAMAAGVHDGDIVSVKADNERGTVFNHVQIRVDDSFTLEMHIDTDEANAAKIAKRHIHMAPKDAMAAGVHDGDIVSVKADNERGTVFNHVQIRVDDSFTLEMHIDTDEANAAKIATGDTVRIIK